MVEPTPFRRPINWDRLRSGEAERLIRERASTTGNVIISNHAFDRIEGRTIIQADLYRILRTGSVEGDPVRNENGHWEAVITRRMASGREAGAATIIVREDDTIFVKTVMWMDYSR